MLKSNYLVFGKIVVYFDINDCIFVWSAQTADVIKNTLQDSSVLAISKTEYIKL